MDYAKHVPAQLRDRFVTAYRGQYLGFTLHVVHFMDLQKCTMTYIHPYSITWNSFNILKTLYLFSHSFSFNSQQPLILSLSPQFCLFQNVI